MIAAAQGDTTAARLLGRALEINSNFHRSLPGSEANAEAHGGFAMTTLHRQLAGPPLCRTGCRVVALTPVFAQSALAHRGQLTTNRYARIEVYRTARTALRGGPCRNPTFQAMPAIDTDNDAARARRTLRVRREGWRRIPEKSTYRWRRYAAGARNRAAGAMLPGQGGLDVLRIVVVYDAPSARLRAVRTAS